MQEVIEINLVQLLKLNININEYLTLLKVRAILDGYNLPFATSRDTLDSLLEKELINYVEEGIIITKKGEKIFKETETPISEKEFEVLFDTYPYKTPSGRILRVKSREIMGKVTRDFDNLYKRYSKIVRNISDHEEIILATKHMAADYKRRGASEYLPKFETYINQRGWEKFLDVNAESVLGDIVERL